MKPNDPIRDVVRVAEAGDKPKPEEKEIFVDAKGAVKTGLLASVRAHRRYVARANYEVEVRSEATLRDFENNHTVVVPYRCRVKIAGSCDTAVVGLFHHDHEPWYVFREEVQKAVSDWWKRSGRQLGLPAKVAVYRSRTRIADEVAKWLAARGLAVDWVAEVDGWDAPAIELKDLAFDVRVSDYPDKTYLLKLSLELQVSSSSGALDPKQPQTESAWIERVTDASRAVVRSQVSLHTYFHDRDALEQALRAGLDRELDRFGRKCGWMVAKTEAPEHAKKSWRDVEFDWQALHGRVVKFNVRLETFIESSGEPLYARHGRPDLDKWFKANLADASKELLLKSDFTVLTPAYADELRNKLEANIKERAASIGIGLRALVLQSKLPEWKYLERFEVVVPQRRYQSVTADFPVQFDMVITGSFGSLDDIQELAWPTDKVEAEVIKVAENAAAGAVRDVRVEDYLTRFEPGTDNPVMPGTNKLVAQGTAAPEYVRDRIAAQVRRGLEDQLSMKVVSVYVRQRDTELIEFMRTFARADDAVFNDVVAKPSDWTFDAQEFKLEVAVRLNGIGPRRAFELKQKNLSPDTIFNTIRRWLQVELESSESAMFALFTSSRDDPLRVKVAKALQEQASASYDAGIELVSFRVLQSDIAKLDQAKKMLQHQEAYLKFVEAKQRINHSAERVDGALAHTDDMQELARKNRLAEAEAIAQKRIGIIKDAPLESDLEADLNLLDEQARRLEAAGGVPALPKAPGKSSRKVNGPDDTKPGPKPY
ncbi:hypothetical protein [Variovorax sp. KK3]|uniref:hypothetical protein n=1 Tax=Variovorax sp. KK3 TaxID=1855728 RepID=UPI001180DA24|nr:hypothetical protein [Variovorax sp. KK3]